MVLDGMGQRSGEQGWMVAWMLDWKSDAKVDVGESNFCVVKYLSLEFGIYMDYFGTDV